MIQSAPAYSPVDNESLRAVLSRHLQRGDCISLWRLPHKNKKRLITSSQSVSIPSNTPVEKLSSGFVFAPFDKALDFFFLEAESSYIFDKNIGEVKKNIPFHTLPVPTDAEFNHKEYVELVKKSIHHIDEGHCQKIVPSRKKIIELSQYKESDPVTLFNQLCAEYRHAFISLVSGPTIGTWIGASPELLVSLDNNMKFKTTSLAGTQAFKPAPDLQSVEWTNKEREEHALVSQYIIDCFKKIKLREFEKCGPTTWQAGNVIHLKTDFTVNLFSINQPQLLYTMLKLLHPTPAVCGIPQKEARDFLVHNEQFDRQFYSGYMGPVNYHNETHLYVNLRCMQWTNTVGVLYAGAGVTADSIPEKEWQETEIKMNTLRNIIKH